MSLYIGVDPGLHGGIVAINEVSHCLFAWAADDPGRGDRIPGYAVGDIDARGLLHELRCLADTIPVAVVAIETPLAFAAGGVTNALRTGQAWGQIRAVLAILDVPVFEVTPAMWSVTVLGKPPKGGWEPKAKKQAAIDACRARVPSLGLVLPGRRIPHDGLADAACIALWAKRQA